MKNATFVLFFFYILVSCEQESNTLPSTKWKIDLDPAIRSLEEFLSTQTQQQPMNALQVDICSLYDAKLKLLFYESLENLSEENKQNALSQQYLWLENRKTEVSKAYAVYQGGTLASFNAGETFLELTKVKIQQLQLKTK